MTQTKKAPKKSLLSTLAVVILATLLLIGQQTGLLPEAEPAPEATVTVAVTAQVTEAPATANSDTGTGQAFYATAPQDIVNYLATHNGQLPDNFLTKNEAQALGWDSSKNYLSDVAPGKSIGGDRFGNYEGLLPAETGRTYREADCYYSEGPRNAYRLVFSNDGLYFYTEDHYESFTEMFPEN